MKEYTTKFGGQWEFLTGTAEKLEETYAAYRVTVNQKAGSSRNQHTWMVCLVDRKGMIRVRYVGQDVPKDVIEKDVRQLLEEEL